MLFPCSAELVMDFHAHLDKHEVIGLLAGTWDPANKVLRVERAFPVRESLGAVAAAGAAAGGTPGSGGAPAGAAAKDLPAGAAAGAQGVASSSSGMGNGSGNDHINVEMDSEDQFKVTEVIQQQYGLQVVGWYHSHPTFTPLPSIIDLGNQLMMQRNAGDEGTPGGEEPYIAAILSPYDSRLPSLQSSVTWFNVAYDKSKVSLDKDLLEQVR
jgi:proteasome lid subunit RPN8/RPN11